MRFFYPAMAMLTLVHLWACGGGGADAPADGRRMEDSTPAADGERPGDDLVKLGDIGPSGQDVSLADGPVQIEDGVQLPDGLQFTDGSHEDRQVAVDSAEGEDSHPEVTPEDAGSDAGSDTQEPEECQTSVPSCVQTCTTSSDCVLPGVIEGGIQDQDNYSCQAGQCRNLGCHSDQECNNTFAASGLSYVCREICSGAGVSSCLPACQVPSDCVPMNNRYRLYDQDHWTCEQGACRLLGCKNNGECGEILYGTGGSYVCFQDVGFSYCRMTCAVPADCTTGSASTLMDADNYSCDGGYCTYRGCNNTQECLEVYSATGVPYACGSSYWAD